MIWNKKKIKKFLPAICLILGIIFLFISEYSSSTSTKPNVFSEEEYVKRLETKIGAILEKLEGVENVSVMITLEGGNQWNTNENQSESGSFLLPVLSQSDTKTENAVLPKVNGICVVCKGGSDARTRLKITSLIASTLNLNENQIYVSE